MLSVTGLDEGERAILIAALIALRHDRGREWRESCRKASEQGEKEPPLEDYGIEEIMRLARRLGGEARHWME